MQGARRRTIKAATERFAATAARLPMTAESVRSQIEEIRQLREPELLGMLRPLFWPSRKPLGSGREDIAVATWLNGRSRNPDDERVRAELERAAVDAVADVLRNSPVSKTPQLDRMVSGDGIGQWELWRHWANYEAPEPADLPAGPERVWLLALLASSPDGYVREKAVVELDGVDSGDELPFLLWRTVDWVAPVRDRAADAVRDRLSGGRLERFAECLGLLRRMEEISRADARELMGAIKKELLTEPELRAVRAQLASPDVALRREAFRFAGEVPPGPAADIVRRAALDADLVVRAYGIRWEPGLRTADPAGAADLRRRYLVDPASALRVQALRAEASADGPAAAPALRRLALDPSASVRYSARFHLKQAEPDFDAAAFYRSALAGGGADGALSRGALGGLGEVGTAADCDLIERYLERGSRVARAALKAMAALDRDRGRRTAAGLLCDSRPGVRREALRIVGSPVDDSFAPVLAGLWRTTSDAEAAETLTAATLRMPPWTSLEVLLDAVEGPSGDVAVSALERWRPMLSACYAAPPAPEEQRRRLEEKIARASARLGQLEARLRADVR